VVQLAGFRPGGNPPRWGRGPLPSWTSNYGQLGKIKIKILSVTKRKKVTERILDRWKN